MFFYGKGINGLITPYFLVYANGDQELCEVVEPMLCGLDT